MSLFHSITTPSPTFSKILHSVFSKRGAYSLTNSTLLGSTIWVTFIAGIISYKALPRQTFGHLQSKLFPAYFTLQSIGSGILGALLYYTTPPPPSSTSSSSSSSSRLTSTTARVGKVNVWCLGIMLGTGLGNWLFVGPWTTQLMKKRHRLERLYGVDAYDKNVVKKNPEIKQINKDFAVAHSVSSLLNLGFLFANVIHTAWLSAQL